MKNKYVTENDITTVYDSNGNSFIIDTNMIDYVGQMKWYVDKTKGYVKSTTTKIYLHKYLMQNTDGVVDHINRDKADNRISNLRICTTQENNMNRAVSKNNQSGIKGVSYCANRNRPSKYKASIGYDGKKIFLGYYRTKEEAEEVYKQKAIELFGEYAPLV